MKATIRIPTVQYGYIELDVEPIENLSSVDFIKAIVQLNATAIEAYKNSLPKADTNNNDDF